jgi:hypothetical protein
MKRVLALVVLLLLSTATILAAQIYGSIWFNGSPLRGAYLRVDCPGDSGQGRTDEQGTFKVYVRSTGRCTLTLTYNGTEVPFPIASYNDPARYDLVLVQSPGRGYQLVRR